MLTVRGWTRIALILIAASACLISARGQFCLKTVRCQAHSHRPFGLSLSKPGRALLGPNGFNGAKRMSTPAGGDGVGIFEPERFKWVQARSMIIQAVGAGCLLCARCGVPRIDQHHRRVGKVADVARDYGQAVLQRRRGNQRIECCHGLARSLGLGAQAGPIPSGIACEGQSPLPQPGLHIGQPGRQLIAATRGWQAHDTSLQFSERQGRDIQIRGRALAHPAKHCRVGRRPHQLRQQARVQKVLHGPSPQIQRAYRLG